MLIDALYGKASQFIETEVKFEDSRRGKVSADLVIRDADLAGGQEGGLSMSTPLPCSIEKEREFGAAWRGSPGLTGCPLRAAQWKAAR